LQKVILIDTGIKNYSEVWDLQKSLFDKVTLERNQNFLIFTEHPPVITIGKSGSMNNLLTDPQNLKSEGIELIEIDRGGDVTFHGPGQIIGYPIFNLNNFKKDIHWYLRTLEEVILQTLKKFGIDSTRIADLTGVWINNKKICAIGVKITRWVTMHGFALNVATDLSYFNHIIPCGINDKGVTSIFEQSGWHIPIEDIKTEIIHSFEDVFQIEIVKREYVL
jgi:lipoyl(octanoyl) transferase